MIAGITPIRTSLKLNIASSAVITRSEAATMPSPPAKAWPFTAAITGFSPSQIAVSRSG